jgi:putative transposase
LNKWFGDSRFSYNKALELAKENRYQFKELEKKIVSKEQQLDEVPKSVNKTPAAIRKQAVQELIVNYKRNFKKGGRFYMRFKSKKDKTQCISLPKKCFIDSNIYKRTLGELKTREEFSINNDFKILYTQPNIYHLIIPQDDQSEPTYTKRVCALDPGYRTFQTLADDRGNIVKFGEGCMEKIKRKQKLRDELQSKLKKATDKKKIRLVVSRLKKQLDLTEYKLKNLVNDMHNRAIKYIVDHYDHVFLPDFRVKQMVMDRRNRFNRQLYSLSHYKFRCKLLSKAQRLGKCVQIVTEEYTSKTCSYCGKIDWNLGDSREYHCHRCGLQIDRDENGAINILQKCSPSLKLIG